MEYVYDKNGKAVGVAEGGYIHDMNGKPVGQMKGSRVHTMSGSYVGEFSDGMILDMYKGDPGTVGYAPDPGYSGPLPPQADRVPPVLPYADASSKLFGDDVFRIP